MYFPPSLTLALPLPLYLARRNVTVNWYCVVALTYNRIKYKLRSILRIMQHTDIFEYAAIQGLTNCNTHITITYVRNPFTLLTAWRSGMGPSINQLAFELCCVSDTRYHVSSSFISLLTVWLLFLSHHFIGILTKHVKHRERAGFMLLVSSALFYVPL